MSDTLGPLVALALIAFGLTLVITGDHSPMKYPAATPRKRAAYVRVEGGFYIGLGISIALATIWQQTVASVLVIAASFVFEAIGRNKIR
ncbi:MAG: hypothetical protein LIV22_06040 [Olegusella sp.]|jgi:hypothetical protein|nr:hypothetical protein [Olegusella sp.]